MLLFANKETDQKSALQLPSADVKHLLLEKDSMAKWCPLMCQD